MLLAICLLADTSAAFADIAPIPFPVVAPLWPFMIVGVPFYGIPLLLVSALIYWRLRKKPRSQGRSVYLAYLSTTVLLIVAYLLLAATGDISFYQRTETPGEVASILIGQTKALKTGVLASLASGIELPLGAFALDSSVVSDDLFPYMDTRLNLLAGETMIVVSSDTAEKTVRSTNAGSAPLYVGFYRHPALTGVPQPRKPGFFGKLFGIQTFNSPPNPYGVGAQLKYLQKDVGLYKNAQGEPYDGEDTVLMKVF